MINNTTPRRHEGQPRGPLSPWRCFVAAVGVLLLGGGVFFLIGAVRENRAFERAWREPVGRIEADLSQVGVYEGTVREWYPIAHGENLWVEISTGEPPPAFPDLRGTLEVIDVDGVVRESAELSGDPSGGSASNQGRIAWFRPQRTGEYTYRLTIIHPEPTLAGIPHRLVARYDLCGCEGLVGLFSGAIGGGLSVVGGLATLATFATGGIRRRVPAGGAVSSSA